jgi:hypothetical protein
MKHSQLVAIAHNLADSLASGCSLVIGIYEGDVFAEATNTISGVIEIDFLAGAIISSNGSFKLQSATHLFADAFPEFCRKNGCEVTDFACFTASFFLKATERYMVLNVVDRFGKASVTEFMGNPLRRPKILDDRGRVRSQNATVYMKP